jgi:hypothetical protein
LAFPILAAPPGRSKNLIPALPRASILLQPLPVWDASAERLIADAERRLRKANLDAAMLKAELARLQRQLVDAKEAGQQLPLPLEMRKRGLSDKWGAVLNFMVLRAPNPVSIDEIFMFATENELQITRAALRAQLHNYEKRGFVERVSDGVYLATSAARAYCDY